jgi:hypothetical protein
MCTTAEKYLIDQISEDVERQHDLFQWKFQISSLQSISAL